MKMLALATCGAAALSAAAMADLTIDLPGGTFFGGESVEVVTTPIVGTLTGVIVSYDYSNAGGGSWASDAAFTVDGAQWGGFDMFINGASVDMGPTGAPDSGDPVSFTSGVLAGTGAVYDGTTGAAVGFGNAYNFEGAFFDAANVQITLIGVDKVPAPGALALLGLAGLVGRRRRA